MAERLLRDRVVRRQFSTRFNRAPIYVSTAGGLKFFARTVERADPVLIATARALIRPGDVVWDIGANIGCFSVAAAVLAGTNGAVWAFEPDAALVGLLRRTACAQSNSTAAITVVPAAVASETGLRTFNVAERARAANALDGYGGSQMGGVRERQTVAAFGLNDCLRWLPAPGVVKIDVEGAECEILQRDSRLLSEIRPAIACEVSAENATAITETLRTAGYDLFDAEALPAGTLVASDHAAFNTIAVPREKSAQFELLGANGKATN